MLRDRRRYCRMWEPRLAGSIQNADGAEKFFGGANGNFIWHKMLVVAGDVIVNLHCLGGVELNLSFKRREKRIKRSVDHFARGRDDLKIFCCLPGFGSCLPLSQRASSAKRDKCYYPRRDITIHATRTQYSNRGNAFQRRLPLVILEYFRCNSSSGIAVSLPFAATLCAGFNSS